VRARLILRVGPVIGWVGEDLTMQRRNGRWVRNVESVDATSSAVTGLHVSLWCSIIEFGYFGIY
jgi:hypothetical protein